jgi:hypothetical protein
VSLEQPIPKSIAVCPYCQGQLYLEVDEWDTETGVPTEAGTHAQCEHDEEEPERHSYMPYVYWLPMLRKVYAWVWESGLIVPRYTKEEELQRLKDWNEGRPL